MSKSVPEVIEPARRILQATGFSGYSCTEFKKDVRDGVYKLLEVNGRHNRSTLLAVRCGLNFPLLEYRHRAEGELPAPVQHRTGVYWISLERDVVYGARYVRAERYTLVQQVRPYLRSHVFDVLDWRDPVPFLWRCGCLATGPFWGGARRLRVGDRPRGSVRS